MKFIRSLQAHYRVVVALMLREIATRYGRSPGGYIWAIIEPLGNVLILTALFSFMARTPAVGRTFALFFATGFFIFHAYRSTEAYVSKALNGNRSLLTFPVVTPYDVVIARWFLQILTLIVIFPVLFTCVDLFIDETIRMNALILVQAFTIACLFALGAAMLNTIIFRKFPFYEKIFRIITGPLLLVSGVIILPENLPHPYGDILAWNPLVHLVAFFRTGFYPVYRAESLDMTYLLVWTVMLLFAGFCAFTWYADEAKES